MKRPTIDPRFACGLAILAIAYASIFIRYAQRAGMPSLVIAAGRLGMAALVLLPVALLRYRGELRRIGPRQASLAFLSGAFLAVHFATWIASLELTTLSSSVVIVCTVPLWVALAAPALLGERLHRAVLAGTLVAIAGGAVVGIADEPGSAAPDPLLGDLLALAGAWSGAGYFLAGRRLRAHLDLIPYVLVTYGASAVLLVAAVPLSGLSFSGQPADAWGWCVLLALVPQLIGHSTFNWALRHLPAATVSVMVLGEPVGAVLLAIVHFGEVPGPLKIAGGLLILCGIAVASRIRPV